MVIKPLCVLAPEIGVLSETFIEWDINHLFPGGTVVVSDPPPRGQTVLGRPAWGTDAPTLAFAPVPGDPAPDAARRADLARFLGEHGVEVVLVQFLDFAHRWVDTLLELEVKVWVRGHGADLSVRLSPSYAAFGAVEGVIVPSPAAAARLVTVGVPEAKIHIVPNHVDLPARPVQRQRRSVIRCLSVGRLVPKKGHRYVIGAFAKAAVDNASLRLDIIGDGPLRPDLAKQITDAGLDDRVELRGALPPAEVATAMIESDLFLHHAVTGDDGDVEGQPLALLEAMAAGLACLTTRHEAIPDLIDHDVSGVLVDERDVGATAAEITALATDISRRQRLAAGAWARVRDHHTHAHAQSRLRELLGLTHKGAHS